MVGRILAAAVAVGLATAGGRAAADKPTPVEVLVREGKALRDAKDYPAAREFFEAAAKLDAKNPAVLVQIAWVHNEQQEYDRAAKVAQEALKVEPGNSDALCELGYAQLKQRVFLKAIGSLRKSVAADDRNGTAYGYLALALRAVGEDEEADAVEATRKAKASQPRPKG